MDILENLSCNKAFLIVDFPMKFLALRYCECMAKWFGKAGMGMHMACVIVKDQEENLKKGHLWYSLVTYLKILPQY